VINCEMLGNKFYKKAFKLSFEGFFDLFFLSN
jgi:hypothetical protein